MKPDIEVLLEHINPTQPIESLRFLAELFPQKTTFSTSLGMEDQIITHWILTQQLPISIFTLDTGRLFPETYQVINQVFHHYQQRIQIYYPNTEAVEQLVSQKGMFSFYESVEHRKECCYIRKVEPLKRALKNQQVWVTGLRAEQSENRKDTPILEWDETHQLLKFHPLLHWRYEEVTLYLKTHAIPYNPLHDKGFVSIGCQPCTRAILDGEDLRAGRWWWEDQSKKECGLHERNPK